VNEWPRARSTGRIRALLCDAFVRQAEAAVLALPELEQLGMKLSDVELGELAPFGCSVEQDVLREEPAR